MKISVKTALKGIVAAGTAIGAGILALQTKKSVDEDNYEPTLEPLGEAPAEQEEAKPEMEDLPTAEAEVVPEETETKEE